MVSNKTVSVKPDSYNFIKSCTVVNNVMNSQYRFTVLRLVSLLILLVCLSINVSNGGVRTRLKQLPTHTKSPRDGQSNQRKMCMPMDNTIRAKHRTCLLRPDSGPCRADILMWYYDARESRCYRFFWGGCQGNGNRFENNDECRKQCYLNQSMETDHIPYFCSLSFDFGNCFGQYNRWAWDPLLKDCRRRLYSGCGGNQNNFETKKECLATCVLKPNNTMNRFHSHTTCIPFTIADMQ